MIKMKTVYFSQYNEKELFNTMAEAEEYDKEIKNGLLNTKLQSFIENIELPEWYSADMYNSDEIRLIKNFLLENWDGVYDIMVEKPILSDNSINETCNNCRYEFTEPSENPCNSCEGLSYIKYAGQNNWEAKE